MSRAITIKISSSVTRVIHVEDGVSSSLEILDIQLPPEQKKANLEKVLGEKEYKKEEGSNWWVKEDGEVSIRIDPETNEIQAGIDHTEERTESGTEDVRGYDDIPMDKSGAKKNLDSKLEKKIEEEKKKRQEEVTRKLEKSLERNREELREIAQKANKENVKSKARSMGEVLEESENGNDVTLRIRV